MWAVPLQAWTACLSVRSYCKKLKWSRYRPGVAQRVGRSIALLFHDRGTRRGCVVSSTPRPHFTQGKIRYPLYRRLGGPQGRSGRAENLVPTGIRSRIVQPVVSHYTDWATLPIIALTVRIVIKFDSWVFFEIILRKFKFWLKSDKNNGYFTWRLM